MKMNLIPKVKYILKDANLFLKFSFFIILNIIICIFIFKNFSYINNKCDIIIISNIFYFIIIFFLLLVINLIYVLLTNLSEKKTFNLCLTILTISTIIILILTLYLKNKVDVSKLSEIFYNIFLQLKVIKIVWNQQELMIIGQQYVIEKSYKIPQEIILNLTTKVRNPEELIEKLNLIYINKLKETTILNNTLNFIYDHKFKILLGTGLTISVVAVGIYIVPILISKFAVTPMIEAVQGNPMIEAVQGNPIFEMGEPGYIEAFKLLDGSEQTQILDLSRKLKLSFTEFELMLSHTKILYEQFRFVSELDRSLIDAWVYSGNLQTTAKGANIHFRNIKILDILTADINKILDFLGELSLR